MTTFVIALDGTKLMPTTNVKKVRKLLKTNRAIIYCYNPFTIQLQYDSEKQTQPIEFTEDTGYQNVGVSLKSEKHEYVSETRILLKDEVEHHNDCRKYRRSRRNRKRYRASRFNNRIASKKKGLLAPSLRNKKDQHVKLFELYNKVCPITSVTLEIGQFDTQVLKAVENGGPIPKGIDYQYGEQYGYTTLREAVFARDKYTCAVCGKSMKENAILKVHHIGYWMGDRTNRLSNLLTVCTHCHTSKNHKQNGKLYGLKPITKSFKNAAFMNSVKFQIYEEFKKLHSKVSITFGSITKKVRNDRNIEKSHANDAYCIGQYYPKHRCKSVTYQKKRRNNRILEKFYDAKYIDIRDGKKKSGKDLGCERTNRKEARISAKNLRIYHGKKVTKGRRSIRKKRYEMQPQDIVMLEGEKDRVVGVQNCGKYVKLGRTQKVVKIEKVHLLHHCFGWYKES